MNPVKRGDIFFANLDPGVGSEQLGTRPCLVIQNDVGNRFGPTTIIAPITSRTVKKRLPTHAAVRIVNGQMDKKSIALLEQVRAIDKSRLIKYIGRADKNTMSRVNEAAECSLGLNTNQEETD